VGNWKVDGELKEGRRGTEEGWRETERLAVKGTVPRRLFIPALQ
jgi:hypothetical protein